MARRTKLQKKNKPEVHAANGSSLSSSSSLSSKFFFKSQLDDCC